MIATNGTVTKTTDYIGGMQYEGNTLLMKQTAFGRLRLAGSAVVYEYYIKDHPRDLGVGAPKSSNRVTFGDPNADGVADLLQEDHYYAFGLKMSDGTQTTSPPNTYRYNAKEYQDELGLAWYDYGARMYDPSIGRWNGVDALAEKRAWLSPFNYVQNNPIVRVDPDGNSDELSDAYLQANAGIDPPAKETKAIKPPSEHVIEVGTTVHSNSVSIQSISTSTGDALTKITINASWETVNKFHKDTPTQASEDGISRTFNYEVAFFVDGNGTMTGGVYSQEYSTQTGVDGEVKMEKSSGVACFANGVISLSSGVSLDVSGTGIDQQITGTMEINRRKDIDAPRLVAQDFKDGTSNVLGLIGLAPHAGVPTYLLGLAMPSAEKMAQEGFTVGKSGYKYYHGANPLSE